MPGVCSINSNEHIDTESSKIHKKLANAAIKNYQLQVTEFKETSGRIHSGDSGGKESNKMHKFDVRGIAYNWSCE